MHNYSIGNRYETKTKIGNWYQQKQKNDYEFKQYLYNKNSQNNITLNTLSKLTFSLNEVELTNQQDNHLHYEDKIMIFNEKTKAILAYDLTQTILGQTTYAVTTTKNIKPALRNVFTIQSVQSNGNIVTYGHEIRLVSMVNNKKLYLQSLPLNPMRSSKFSRHQQVSVTQDCNQNSIWILQHQKPSQRFDMKNKQVFLNDRILIKHCLTSQWLASDLVNYINSFGNQYEVFAKSYLTNNKTQNLYAEKTGHKSVENAMRNQSQHNLWHFIKGKR